MKSFLTDHPLSLTVRMYHPAAADDEPIKVVEAIRIITDLRFVGQTPPLSREEIRVLMEVEDKGFHIGATSF